MSQRIYVDEVIKKEVLKEGEGGNWEGIIEECNEELYDLSTQFAEDVSWSPYRGYHSDEPSVTGRVEMRPGSGGKYLLSSSDEYNGDDDNGEPLREKQSVDVWFPPT